MLLWNHNLCIKPANIVFWLSYASISITEEEVTEKSVDFFLILLNHVSFIQNTNPPFLLISWHKPPSFHKCWNICFYNISLKLVAYSYIRNGKWCYLCPMTEFFIFDDYKNETNMNKPSCQTTLWELRKRLWWKVQDIRNLTRSVCLSNMTCSWHYDVASVPSPLCSTSSAWRLALF